MNIGSGRCMLSRWISMRISNLLKAIKSPEHRLALLVAMAGDAVQILALPLFAGGGFSPADTLLDAFRAVILERSKFFRRAPLRLAGFKLHRSLMSGFQ